MMGPDLRSTVAFFDNLDRLCTAAIRFGLQRWKELFQPSRHLGITVSPCFTHSRDHPPTELLSKSFQYLRPALQYCNWYPNLRQ